MKAVSGWRITWLAAAVLVALVAAIFAVLGYDEASVRVVVRTTARTSVVLFGLAFCASSLRRLWPTRVTAWLLRNRRYVGVSFAVSHALHLAALGALAVSFPSPFLDELEAATVIGGGLAYGFIAAMAFTSSDRAVARLGRRRWRALHLVGGYYVWLIFTVTVLPRTAAGPEYLLFVAVLAAVLLVRAAPRLRGLRLQRG